MLIALLPLVATSIDAVETRVADRAEALAAITAETDVPASSTARTAQVKLADVLGNADSIESVTAHGNAFTFVITRRDHRVDVIAKTASAIESRGNGLGGDGGGHEGLGDDVVDVIEHDRGPYELDEGGLSWLVDTMQETTAVTRLDVDEDGAVTLTTSDGARYMAIPGRGSGGNAEAEARWAGEWDRGAG